MPDSREQLDVESLMLLYIAGELTNGAKAAFEKRLASDPKLASELAKIRETQLFCADALRVGDATTRLPVSEGVAVRRVGRVLSQWQVDRARTVVANGVKTRRIPVWAYPAAAAAILIIGFLTWSSRQPIALPPPGGDDVAIRTGGDDAGDSQEALADWIDTSFGNTQEAANTESALSVPDPGPLSGSDDASIYPMPEETIQ